MATLIPDGDTMDTLDMANTISVSESTTTHSQKRSNLTKWEVTSSNSNSDISPLKLHKSAPPDPAILPPCRVCNLPASGFHYGANTCEACKGFFRRGLKLFKNYRCSNDGDCEFGKGFKARTWCTHCRYQKCLTVGMSREGIKTGRYTHEQRAKYIMELNRMKGKKSRSSIVTEDVSYMDSQRMCQYVSAGAFPLIHPQRPAYLDPDNLIRTNSHRVDVNTSDFTNTMGDQTHDCDKFDNMSFASSYAREKVADMSLEQTKLGSLMVVGKTRKQIEPGDSLRIVDMASKQATECDYPGTVEWTHRQTERDYPGTVEWTREQTERNIIRTVAITCEQADHNVIRTVGIINRQAEDPDFFSTVGIIHECSDERDSLIESIITGYKEWNPFWPHLADEKKLRERQLKFYEERRTKNELFGNLRFLTKTESYDFYNNTGIDIDGRRRHVCERISDAEVTLKRWIRLMTGMRILQHVPKEDMISLLVVNSLETGILAGYKTFDLDLEVGLYCNGELFSMDEFPKWMYDYAKDWKGLMRRLLRLELTIDEIALLDMVCFLSTDRAHMNEPEKIEELQLLMMSCLRQQLARTRPNHDQIFYQIWNYVIALRDVSNSHNYKDCLIKTMDEFPEYKESPILSALLELSLIHLTSLGGLRESQTSVDHYVNTVADRLQEINV